MSFLRVDELQVARFLVSLFSFAKKKGCLGVVVAGGYKLDKVSAVFTPLGAWGWWEEKLVLGKNSERVWEEESQAAKVSALS